MNWKSSRVFSFWICVIFLGSFGIAQLESKGAEAEKEKNYPLDYAFEGAISSVYSDKILGPLSRWPWKEVPQMSEVKEPVWIRGIKTESEADMIGSIRRVQINAPMKEVLAMIKNFEGYPSLFEDLESVKILEQDRNKVVVRWERESPFFLAANPKYDQAYVFDESKPNRTVFRYQLLKGNSVKSADGIVVLEDVKGKTILSGIDFFLVRWGIVKSIAGGKIWHQSLEGSIKGDLALKLKAENPTWDQEKIEEETKKILKQFPLEPKFIDNFDWGI